MRQWSILVVLCASALVFGCAAGDAGGGSVDLTNCVDQDNDNHYTGLQCAVASDCNDRDRTIYPGAIEIPGDGKDNDCKGGDAAKPNDCGASVDRDRDGYFDPNLPADKIPQDCLGKDCFDDPHSNPCQVANAPPGVCLNNSNVAGSRLRGRQINPGRREIANNGIDDDCNPATQDDAPNCTDVDGDGYGPQGNSDCPGRLPTDPVDCNDADGDVNPGAGERCDGKDNNCNNTTDECAQANYACSSTNQGSCTGVLGGACTNHRDCGANFRCKDGSCKAFTGGDCGFSADANDDCYSGVCGDNLKCAGDICQILTCGAANPCGAAPSACDSALGRCVECRDSSANGGCGCSGHVCAGYQCYQGEYQKDVVDKGVSAGGSGGGATVTLCEDTCGPDDDSGWAGDDACDDGGEDSEFDLCDLGTDCTDCGERQGVDDGGGEPAGPPAAHPVVQVGLLLLDCFGFMGDDAPHLCAAINAANLSAPVNEDQIDDFFCQNRLPDEERDDLAAELLGGGQADRGRDLAGCGIVGSLFGDDLKFENAIGPNAEYRDCIWYHDNRVQVGDCMLYPSEL